MSYNDIVQIVHDMDLRQRVAAGAAVEGYPIPWLWTEEHIWQVAAQPGWAAAYASAIAAKIERPGLNEGVITDGMILSGVQAVYAAEKATGTMGSEEGI